jgi:hypothetical protein
MRASSFPKKNGVPTVSAPQESIRFFAASTSRHWKRTDCGGSEGPFPSDASLQQSRARADTCNQLQVERFRRSPATWTFASSLKAALLPVQGLDNSE